MDTYYTAVDHRGTFVTYGESWVDPVNGSDSGGIKNRRDAPFKSLEPAYAAMSEWDTIHVIPSGGTLNSTSAMTITKGGIVVCDSQFNNASPNATNFALTITMSTRRPIYFKGIIFSNSSLQQPCVTVTGASDHVVQFDDCYFINTSATPTCFAASGAWLNSGTTGIATTRARVILNRCLFAGKLILASGTAGSPFDLKGLIEIRENILGYAVSLPGVIQIDSGAVLLERMAHCPQVVLNGGIVVIRDCDFPYLDSSSNAIVANSVTTPGISFLIIDQVNLFTRWRNPITTSLAGMGKISIGANVVYQIDNLFAIRDNVTIHPQAIELQTYLRAGGSNAAFSVFNSSPILSSASPVSIAGVITPGIGSTISSII